MMLQDTSERPTASDSFEASDLREPVARHEISETNTLQSRLEPWPQRVLARIRQGERYQACAYFLSTIL